MDPYKNISKEYGRFLKHDDIKREVNFLSGILKKGSVLDAGCEGEAGPRITCHRRRHM